MLSFKEFSIGDREEFERLCREFPSPSCERCFATSYVWRIFFDYRVAMWRDRLVIFENSNGWLMYPLGRDTPPEELLELVELTREAGFEVKSVYDAPPDYPQTYPSAAGLFEVSAEEKYFDYLYDLKKLSGLSGPILRKKRNHVKRFKSENPDWICEPVGESNISQAREFMESMEAGEEIAAISCAFDNFFELGFSGILLRAGGGPIMAAAVMGKINDDVWDVNFEKSDKSVEGAPQMIVQLEADYLLGRGAKFMNREQDMGLENLRHAKRSLDPIMFRRLMLNPAGGGSRWTCK